MATTSSKSSAPTYTPPAGTVNVGTATAPVLQNVPGTYSATTGQLNPGMSVPNASGGTTTNVTGQNPQVLDTTGKPIPGAPKLDATGNIIPGTGSTNLANAGTAEKIGTPAGWDPVTYANFKSANPTIEPNAQDTAIMNSTQSNPGLGTSTSTDNAATGARFKAGLDAVNASGAAAPVSAGAGSAGVKSVVPPAPGPQANPLQTAFQTSPQLQKALDQQMADRTAFLSSQNQQKTLTQQYADLTASSGINQLNTDLMNMKNIIDGTEDDIRNEVTKAGGFATNSQVLAMTSARNKTVIQNYNNLLQTRQNAVDQINTMIGLSKEDKANAVAQFNEQMNFDGQQVQMAQQMQTNAQQSMQKIADKVGYAGLQKMTGGDPYYTSLVENTLGLGAGGLKQLALVPDLDREQKLASIAASNASAANSYSEIRARDAKTAADLAANSGTDKLQSTTNQIDTANSILGNKAGLNASVNSIGFTPSRLFNQGAYRDFIASTNQLTSQLSLNSLINAKKQGATFGALSDSELNVLANSATKINSWAQKDKDGNVTGYLIDKPTFSKEIDRINALAKKDYILKGGAPENVGVQRQQDGTYWTQNSDGSLTQIQ